MTPNSQRWSQWLSRISTRQVDVALALLVTAGGLLLFAFAGIGGNRGAGFLFLQNVEQSLLDTRFELRGSRKPDERIVIVGIDEKTLMHEGSFPLPRRAYAELVKRLSAEGARVVAFDATFPTPESNSATQALNKLQANLGASAPSSVDQEIKRLKIESDQDGAFAASLKASGNVVLGHLFLDAERAKNSNPKLEEEYFNIVWAKSFPQVLKVKSKDGKDFDLAQAWVNSGGTVAAGAEANITKLAEAAVSYGFFNINPDPDGTLRTGRFDCAYQRSGLLSLDGHAGLTGV